MNDGVNPRNLTFVSDPNGESPNKVPRSRRAGALVTRDKLTMAEMKARMAALWKAGESYVEIGNKVSDEFNLPENERLKANAIHYHIKGLLEYWRAQGLLHVDERQAMVLARYDQLEMLCMEGYWASCLGKNTTNYEKQVERARSPDREKVLLEQISRERQKRREELPGNRQGNPKFEFEIEDGELADMLLVTHEKTKEYARQEESIAGDPKWIRLLIDINDKRARLWGLMNKKGPDNDDQERAKLSDEQRDERLAAVLSAAMHRKAQGQTNLAPATPLGGFDDTTIPAEEEHIAEEVQVEPEQYEIGPESDEEFEFDFSEEQ